MAAGLCTPFANLTPREQAPHGRKMRRQLLTLALLAAASVASAASSSGSSTVSPTSSTSSTSSSSSASSAASDECAALTYAGGCWYDVTCAACLDRSGCALEAATGACVSSDRVPAGEAGVSYFLSTNASYCDAADAQCSACLAGSASGNDSSLVCRGSNGCVCSSECEAIPTTATSCGAGTNGASQLILVMASGVMVTALIIMSIRSRMGLGAVLLFAGIRMRKWWKALRNRRRAQQQRDLQRASASGSEQPQRKTLKLEGWRRVMDAQQALGALELETCYIQMPRESSTVMTDASSARASDGLDELSLSVLDVAPTRVQEVGTPRSTDANRSAQSMV